MQTSRVFLLGTVFLIACCIGIAVWISPWSVEGSVRSPSAPDAEINFKVLQGLDLVAKKLDDLEKALAAISKDISSSKFMRMPIQDNSQGTESVESKVEKLSTVVSRLENLELRADALKRMSEVPRNLPVDWSRVLDFLRRLQANKGAAVAELSMMSAEGLVHRYGSPNVAGKGDGVVYWDYVPPNSDIWLQFILKDGYVIDAACRD